MRSAAHQVEVGGAEATGQLLGGDRLHRLLLPGGAERALEVDDLPGGAGGDGVEDAADGPEVEAVGLHAQDEPQPGGVLVVVVAGASPHRRWRQQAAGLVGADVARGHPRGLGELVDGVDGLAAATGLAQHRECLFGHGVMVHGSAA
jgi:hypothetical protein